mgnify:CR=1 FL=1
MFTVIVHRKVLKFIKKNIKDENIRRSLINAISDLQRYPLVLRERDVEKIKGMERVFRIRVGRYRIIFYVDKSKRTIYVTHIGIRGRIY